MKKPEVLALTAKDQEQCTQWEAEKNAALQFVRAYTAFLQNHGVSNTFYKSQKHELVTLEATEQHIAEAFVANIHAILSDRYSITIDRTQAPPIRPDVTAQAVLAEASRQLSGVSMSDRALSEIRQTLRRRYPGTWTLTKDTLAISRAVHFQDGFRKDEYSLDPDAVLPLFRALSFFEFGIPRVHDVFWQAFSHHYQRGAFWFQRFSLAHTQKVKALRYYKNGRVDVIFVDAMAAAQFLATYHERNSLST